MKVLKFGGTSLADANRLRTVKEIVSQPGKRIVVLSAFAGTTNSLIEMANQWKKKQHDLVYDHLKSLEEKYKQIAAELFQGDLYLGRIVSDMAFHRIYKLLRNSGNRDIGDQLVAYGEQLSTMFLYRYLNFVGLSVEVVSALETMRIDQNGEPQELFLRKHWEEVFSKNHEADIFLTEGFICCTNTGEISNLGRGGSDYTASLIGQAVGASEIEIWSDIDGFRNNDPRYVENTQPIREMTFDEAAELAYFGAKIMHPSSVLPARKANIPIRLKNTLNPQEPGTVIGRAAKSKSFKAIAAKDDITVIGIQSDRMLNAYGFLRSVFQVFEIFKTPIDVITTSEVGVSLTIDNIDHIAEIVHALGEFGTTTVNSHQAIVCAVGDFSADRPKAVAAILNALEDIPLRMVSCGGSHINVTVVMDEVYKSKALTNLQKNLFGDPKKMSVAALSSFESIETIYNE